MRKCINCGKEHNRKTRLCNSCYNNLPNQIEKRRERDRRYYKRLSSRWKQERSKLVCERCGRIFAGNRANQKYCSITCQRNTITKKPRSFSKCVICGKRFKQIRRDSKACSKECVIKWEYVKRNKDKKRFYERTREARIRCNGGNFSWSEWKKMKQEYKYTCPACLKKEPEIELTIDHIIPVSKGGKHTKSNIQPLCRFCNTSKNNHLIPKYERPK